MRFQKFVSGPWKENGYVVSSDNGESVIIDPGGELEAIKSYVAQNALSVHAILNTHAHYDHLGAVVPIKEAYNVPFYLHSADDKLLKMANFYRTLFLGEENIRIPSIDIDLSGVSIVRLGSIEIEIAHTPGHTPGSVCFVIDGEIFSGDTIMAKHVGRTDLPGGDKELLFASVRLLTDGFSADTPIHPGHGESATIGDVLPRLAELTELRG